MMAMMMMNISNVIPPLSSTFFESQDSKLGPFCFKYSTVQTAFGTYQIKSSKSQPYQSIKDKTQPMEPLYTILPIVLFFLGISFENMGTSFTGF